LNNIAKLLLIINVSKQQHMLQV